MFRKIDDWLGNRVIGFLGVVSVILFICTIFSFACFIYSNWHLSFSPTNTGFSYFFSLFSPTLKFGTAFLAVLTLWLAARKFEQNEKNISIMDDNNRFNNYYKHKTLFVEYFMDTQEIKDIDREKISESHIKYVLNLTYSDIYYPSYDKFSPCLNDDAKDSIVEFFQKISKSPLNIDGKYQCDNMDIEFLKDMPNPLILKKLNNFAAFITQEYIVKVRDYCRGMGYKDDIFKQKSNLILTSINLYHKILLSRYLATFDGLEIAGTETLFSNCAANLRLVEN